MHLHNDLEALLPRLEGGWFADGPNDPLAYLTLTPSELTAFALAVARQERERCAAMAEEHGAAAIDDLDDPAWAGGTDA